MPTRPRKHSILSLPGIAICAAALLFAGCGDGGDGAREPQANTAALESHRQTLERRAPGCGEEDEECASVAIHWVEFEGRQDLNLAIREQLARQLQGYGEDNKPAGSLEAAADAFLAEAAQMPEDTSSARWQLTGDAKPLARRGDLLTVELSSYHYSGGAHGLPATHWLNWDLAADKPVSLEQVLQPGQEKAFWNLAQAAHERWMKEQDAGDDYFRQNWPFQKTEDFRFDDQGLALLYGVYVLGPYAIGQVELTVPRDELRGVVRDKYLVEQE